MHCACSPTSSFGTAPNLHFAICGSACGTNTDEVPQRYTRLGAIDHGSPLGRHDPTYHGHVAPRGGKSGLRNKPIFPQPLCLSKQHECGEEPEAHASGACLIRQSLQLHKSLRLHPAKPTFSLQTDSCLNAASARIVLYHWDDGYSSYVPPESGWQPVGDQGEWNKICESKGGYSGVRWETLFSRVQRILWGRQTGRNVKIKEQDCHDLVCIKL